MATSAGVTDVETVVLRGGLAVPLAALQLLWRLEEKGCSLAAVGGGLDVWPRERITAEDDRAIRRHRDELLALVQHCEVIQ